ncbi:hypothetical protein BO443_30031 [Burkholderia orbicola]
MSRTAKCCPNCLIKSRPTSLSIPSAATAHTTRRPATPRSPRATRCPRFRLAKAQFTGRLPRPTLLGATKLSMPSLKAVDANESSKAVTTVVRWPRTRCTGSRLSRVRACGHVVPIPRRPKLPFEWACSTVWPNSPARSPSALPDISNKGITSSSRLIYATTPWQRAWEHVVPFYVFPPEIRRVVYTTDEMYKSPRRTSLVRYVRASGHRIGALSDLGRDCFHRLNSL